MTDPRVAPSCDDSLRRTEWTETVRGQAGTQDRENRLRTHHALRQPFCIDCAEAEFNRLESEDEATDTNDRLSREELRLLARLDAQMVRIFGEWVCPRCEKVDRGTALTPEVVSLGEVLPNRAARRRFEQNRRRSLGGSR